MIDLRKFSQHNDKFKVRLPSGGELCKHSKLLCIMWLQHNQVINTSNTSNTIKSNNLSCIVSCITWLQHNTQPLKRKDTIRVYLWQESKCVKICFVLKHNVKVFHIDQLLQDQPMLAAVNIPSIV